jgi:hypothetical protein
MMTEFASKVFMVRPAMFGPNPETAETNTFQSKIVLDPVEMIREKAVREFDTMVAKIREAGVDVEVFQDSQTPAKPDAVFPNNWISTHVDGTVVVYPMQSPNRQLEVREDIIDFLQPKKRLDLREWSPKMGFLEGTGSLIFDASAKVVYACISPRTSWVMAQYVANTLGYSLCTFHASDHQGVPFYHTNVVMFVMKNYVVVGLETISDKEERKRVEETIIQSGKKILELSYYQITQFAGNMLQLRNASNELLLLTSSTAWNALSNDQKRIIEQESTPVIVDIPTIEMYGGGSARCMIAENFIHEKEL